MDIKQIIANSLNQSYSAEEYQTILTNFAADGKTSGEQNEDLIYYTKLNAQRAKRIGKTAVIGEELAHKIKELPKQIWLLITETWCGDAANSVPVIAKLAELNPSIDLRIVLRDENLDLMDQFLTKGGRSIPKLIAMDEDLNVLFDWGPRPKDAQELYWGWRERDDREPYKEFQVTLQKWYNENRSEDVQKEIAELLHESSNIMT